MQPLKLVAALAAVMITASLLAGVRSGFEATPVTPGAGSQARTLPATAPETAHRASGTNNRADAGSAITMPYYSYGASLPTLLKD